MDYEDHHWVMDKDMHMAVTSGNKLHQVQFITFCLKYSKVPASVAWKLQKKNVH